MICARFPRVCAVLIILSACLGSLEWNRLTAAEPRPNVLLILADDVGWAEFGFQGESEIPTPHIDSIAAGGVKFTQGYVSCPVCSPSRAGLMTGRYQTRFGHESNSQLKKLGLNVNQKTIADRMKSLGYATCAVGKWHLGELAQYHPLERGFDEYFGTLANSAYFHPTLFVDSRQSADVLPIDGDEFYTTEQYGVRAADWIEKHQDKPWFVYLPFNAIHNPLEAPQAYLDRFPHIADPKRRTFAAMMACMDDSVGKVLKKVEELGQTENTLIVFLSDNGGPSKSTTSSNLPLQGTKHTLWEGGIRIPFCMQWKGRLPAGKVYPHPVIQLDILPTIIHAAGGQVDAAWKLDGVDLVPYLTGQQTDPPHASLFWRYGDQWAVRHGDYKLVVAEDGSGRPELYHLPEDISEADDLAKKLPAKAKQLQALYDDWDAEQAPPQAKMTANDKKPKKKKASQNSNQN